MQKALGRGESMVIEFGCVAAFSEACKIVAEERTGLVREPPYAQGFAVKITGEINFTKSNALFLFRPSYSYSRSGVTNRAGPSYHPLNVALLAF